MPALCDVVIPIWNQPALTRRCLESILQSTSEPTRLILIDNGSLPETRGLLEEWKAHSPVPVLLLRNETNLGFIRAVNQGIRAASAPWVCLLNNDTLVTSGWLTEMLKVAESDPSIGLVNPTSNSLGFHPGEVPLEPYAAGLKKLSGTSTDLTTALGFCLLSRRELLASLGGLDESYGMGNFDDDDLSRRARQRGLRCVRACGSYVFHEEKASFRHLPSWEEAFEENRRRFEAKWGKRLRILCEKIPADTALALLKEGHWLYLLGSMDDLPKELSSQAQVACLGFTRGPWRLKATLRLLTKRKKPFDLIIAFDSQWSRWLKRLRGLYRAQLLVPSSDEEILRQCQTLSQSR